MIRGPIAQAIERRLVDRLGGLPLVDALLVVEGAVAAVATGDEADESERDNG